VNTFLLLFVPFALVVLAGYIAISIKVVNEGNEALVERFGRYNRKLRPGINFIIPVLDSVVLEDTLREQVLDVAAQKAITKDSVSIEVDAIVYWRIFDLEKAYYAINNLELAIENLVNTTLRSEVGKMKLEQTFSATTDLNKTLLPTLDQVTSNWGVKILRVEVQHLNLPQRLIESMELERAAEIRKRASIAEAEGLAESMNLIIQTLQSQGKTPPNMSEILKFLIAQKYVQASQEISKSPNSKIIFMDPKALTESINRLMESDTMQLLNPDLPIPGTPETMNGGIQGDGSTSPNPTSYGSSNSNSPTINSPLPGNQTTP
jgi:regulator of protease activity HflC (stomatin/prohibitin superfamily)